MAMHDQDELRHIYIGHFGRFYERVSTEYLEQMHHLMVTSSTHVAEIFLREMFGSHGLPARQTAPLHRVVTQWIEALFVSRGLDEIPAFVERQLQIGGVHAHRKVAPHLFSQARRILQREFCRLLVDSDAPRAVLADALISTHEIVALATSLISESYLRDLVKNDDDYRLQKALKQTVAVVLAGGRGTRLQALTATRAKPALPFGGVYRLIDFPLSNCVNSGIRHVGVLTQYDAHELIQHVQRGWNIFRGEFNEFLEVWPADQRQGSSAWYLGTADAVHQNMTKVLRGGPRHVLVLAADHVYRQDYSRLLADHLRQDADVTLSCVEVGADEASRFGVVEVDTLGRVHGFHEKAACPPERPDRPGRFFASTGIYIFNVDVLQAALLEDAALSTSSHDFGGDILPRLVKTARVFAHAFERSCVMGKSMVNQGYWRDVGTIDAYWEANLELTRVTPALDLYDEAWPILSLREQLPPAKFVFDDETRRGTAVGSLISPGCIISGATIRRSLLFCRVRVHSFAKLEDAVVLPGVEVGAGCRLRRVIIDTGCVLPEHLVVGEDPVLDAARFIRTDGGVVLITALALAQLANA